jgi:Zn-finger nucleic acid-binding protein
VRRVRSMLCPRCKVELQTETYQGIDVDHCPSCHGRWLDYPELDELEATVASEDERRAQIIYDPRPSDLACPKCGKKMTAFDYRAYNLELNTCEDQHGFWLDAGEEGRIHDIIEERVRGLHRAASAEASWGQFLDRMRHPSFLDHVKGFFRGR